MKYVSVSRTQPTIKKMHHSQEIRFRSHNHKNDQWVSVKQTLIDEMSFTNKAFQKAHKSGGTVYLGGNDKKLFFNKLKSQNIGVKILTPERPINHSIARSPAF